MERPDQESTVPNIREKNGQSEQIDSIMSALGLRINELLQISQASPEERELVKDLQLQLGSALRRVGSDEAKRKSLAEKRQEIIEKLGDQYETKIKAFMDSLDVQEQLLAQSFILRQVADLGNALNPDLSAEQIFNSFLNLTEDELISIYHQSAKNIHRNIGEEILDKASGQTIKITEKNWRTFGTRGKWFQQFDPILNSLLEKTREFKMENNLL